MIPYLITFILSLSLFYAGTKHQGIVRIIFFCLAVLPPAILGGCRDLCIGTDTLGYPTYTFDEALTSYSLLGALKDNDVVEPLFVTVAYLVSEYTRDIHWFLFVNQLIMIIGVAFLFGKSRIDICLAMFLYLFSCYNTSLNAMRQSMSIPFCGVALIALIGREYILCAVSMIIAYFFHYSSILFISILALYWLIERIPYIMGRKITLAFSVVVLSLILYNFSYMLETMVAVGLTEEKYDALYGNSDVYGTNIPISQLALHGFNLAYFWLVTRYNKRTSFWILSNYVLMTSLILCFLGLISTYAVRVVDYFLIVNIVTLTYYTTKNSYRYVSLPIIFYLFYWFMTVVVADLGYTYPYKSRILESLI